MISKIENAFLSLVRAGLWEKEVQLVPYGDIDFAAVQKLAEEQGILGLVAAGIEHIVDAKPQKKDVLQFIGRTVQMEQRNQEMNHFIGALVEKMRDAGIFTLLVKGQGVAQCYERPLWRSSGDVDFLYNDLDWQRADAFFAPFSSYRKYGGKYSKEVGFGIDPWVVEIHGTLRSGLSARVDKMIDAVQADVFLEGKVRMWKNGVTDVYLPAPDHDVFLVFTHFIKHLYKEGMNLRQVCDWCRLLWTYRSELDVALQERWLRKAGLMGEWQVFAALAVEYLGMPADAMPLFNETETIKRKSEKLMAFIIAGGGKHKVRDTFALAKIFPGNTIKFLPSIFLNLNWLKVWERVMGREL